MSGARHHALVLSHLMASAQPHLEMEFALYLVEETKTRNREMTGQGHTANSWYLGLQVLGQALIPHVRAGTCTLMINTMTEGVTRKPLKQNVRT